MNDGPYPATRGRTRALLVCGMLVAPLFYAVVIAQMALRAGFDIRRHPLSLLSLGPLGWVQIANFAAAGVLALACAVGLHAALRDGPGRRWAPFLVAGFGVGMLIAGAFPPDPLLGFPPGAPQGIASHMSGHAMMHGVGFFIAFGSLIAACFVFARRYRALGDRGWAGFCLVVGAIVPVMIGIGMAVQSLTGPSFFVVGIVAFGWLGVVAWQTSAAHEAGARTLTS
ncbi:MAG: DUF998 domain-containing protein [Sphingomonas sp.]